MLEQLITSGLTAGQAGPDTGPGNKVLLYGTTDLGYFGEVSSAELFTSVEIQMVIPVAGGTDITPPDKLWLKFYFKGKILYIAKKPLKSGVSWNDIYAAGGVYGTNDNGLYPGSPAVNQYHPMTKVENGRSWTLVPRLIRAVNGDPASASSYSAAGYVDSEWSQLFGRIANATNDATTEKWARFTNTELGGVNNYFGTLGQETYGTNVLYCAQAGDGGSLNSRVNRLKTARTSTYAFSWRPVLDLII